MPPKKVHLFNCDRTYKLDAVEGLLKATKAKLGFDQEPDPVVEKHYFSVAQMHEIADITIPKLKIDVAFFVVHAHESRLSINEDNAGIGYAKIYRALLEATGKSSQKAEVRERAIMFPHNSLKIFRIRETLVSENI